MKDERIDQTLKALTGAEAPEGLEQRVLRRLDAHRMEPAVGRRWMVPVCALGACALVALIVGVRVHVAPVPSVAPVAGKIVIPGKIVQPQPLGSVVAHVEAPVASHKQSPRRVSVAVAEVSFPAPPAPLTEQERLLVRLAEARKREAAPWIEVAAEQMPKREGALTHEEMLLVAVSHVRQDAVIDALDPVRRAEADAREKQEFKAYVRQKDGGSDETRP